MSKLALLGGDPLIKEVFKPYMPMDEIERKAVEDVMKEGILSSYIAAAGDSFMGGVAVKELEDKAEKYFGVKHAIAVNSWTSGLICSVGAIGIEPGDHVITSPWTMAATATAILHWNAIPIFADIDPLTFNIDPKKVEDLITEKTKAILAVDIFGQSADMTAINEIAQRYDLKIISDTAQAPGVKQNDSYAGSLGDIGGYSLNYHKHIHCGEGGIIVTDDTDLWKRLCLIRNHAEAVIESDDPKQLTNMLGYNFRLGEIEATIANHQLDKLEAKVKSRQRIAEQLNEGLSELEGLNLPFVSENNTHAYYVYGMILDNSLAATIGRKNILAALKAEGVPALMEGYQNIHLLPLFKNKIAFGSEGYPWSNYEESKEIEYRAGLCPIAEDYHLNRFLGIGTCMCEFSEKEIELVILAFKKVWSNLELIKNL